MGRVLPEDRELAAAVLLRHALGFEEVALPVARLSYEPRSSCQCTRACATVWVGAKSGAVMRLELTGHRPTQSWFPGDREARSVCHVHDELAPGRGSVLLIGRDDGCLEIVPDRHPAWTHEVPPQRRASSTARFHLDAWWERRTELTTCAIDDVVECAPGTPGHYAMGVTAIAALPRPHARDTVEILVATRYPWLYLVEARAGALRLARRMSLPGWIDWILPSRHPDGPVTCISRGGDLVRFTHEGLLRGDPPAHTALSILPTAALRVGTAAPAREPMPDQHDDALLIGTTTGLFLVRDDPRDQLTIHALPVTRAGVLSLGSTAVHDRDGAHDYVTLGLDDGRLRVVDVELIRGRSVGVSPRGTTQNFSIELGDAVLAEQTLQPEGCPANRAYVLAVLRNHAVRLFQVTSDQTQRELVLLRWDVYLRGLATWRTGPSDVEFELDIASAGPPSGIEPGPWGYMLVDVVLPRLCARSSVLPPSERSAVYDRIFELACALVGGADPRVLPRVSNSLHALSGGDIRIVQQLSAAVVRAAMMANDARATAFIESHLRDLNTLAGACTDRDRPLLVFWMRFVRKYILLGPTFAAKRLRLVELVEQNYQARKHLDALIYQARLHRCGYDLRWETRLADEVAAVHFAQRSERAIVVVVTVGGRLVVLDRANGEPLVIVDRDRSRKVLVPFEADGEVRTLASMVVEDRGVTRVVVSCDGAKLRSPGVAVIDLSIHPRDPATVAVASVSRPTCEASVRVHAVEALPGRANTFVVGLDARAAPVGRLHFGRTWELECATRAENVTARAPIDPWAVHGSQLASGKVPTRALCVIETDARASRFLAVAGADDGNVLAFDFTAEESATRWRLTAWDRVPHPIRCVVLGRHDQRSDTGNPMASEQSLFSCYLGTAAGDTLALSIVRSGERLGGTTRPFGGYHAQALWRETHEGPVVIAQLWQTSMFPRCPDQVLVVATESGRLCVYHHAGGRSNHVSARNNYYFRGMRFERIALPGRIRALSLADDEDEIIAAGTDGHVYLARLVYLRESNERRDPEIRPPRHATRPDSAGGATTDPPRLPTESWARLRHLFEASQIDEPFDLPHDQRHRRKLELCELIRLDDGVLSTYALRERLTFHEPWNQLDPGQLRARARALLHGLRPDHREHAERIKVVLKSLCGAFLSRHPDRFREELLAQRSMPATQQAAIAAACDLVCDEILDHLTHATRARTRLAIVAMKELLRVPVLWAMAGADEHGARVRDAVGAAFTACLRHDDRVVRTEVLRAAAVMLRNVGVMVQASADARDRLLAAVFPDGLASLAWLLDLIIDDLLRSPGFDTRTVLVSGAWYRVSVLAQLFWIFPDHTLALCDHIVGRGLGIEVLALCVQTMRGDQVRPIRDRIERWFLLPAADPDVHRDRFIDHYQLHGQPAVQPPPVLTAAWHTIDDAAMAERMGYLLDQLARMWGSTELAQLRAPEARLPRPKTAPGEPHRTPLAAVERVVARLTALGRDLADAGRQDDALQSLRALVHQDSDTRARLTRPMQAIVSAIALHWSELCQPRAPESGMQIGAFELGRYIGEGGFGKVFEVAAPREYCKTHVIKVLKRFTPEARELFVRGARLNQELSTNEHVVKIVEIIGQETRWPAYLMLRYRHALDHYLGEERRDQLIAWAPDAARHIAEALLAAHSRLCWHGDVKASNILVKPDVQIDRAWFFLADFDLAQVPDDSSYGLLGIVPRCLSRKCESDDPARIRQWHDVAALGVLAYRMLTGEQIRRDTTNLEPYRRVLDSLATQHRDSQPTRHLITTLQRVFDPGTAAVDIHEFLNWLKVGPLPLGPTKVLFLAANPTDTQHLPELDREYQAIHDCFSGRPDVELDMKVHARVHDMINLLSTIVPDVLHFGGHGSPLGVMLEGEDGTARVVTGEALESCLRERQIALVILLSCYSEHQCDAILKVVDAVVGCESSIPDRAARLYAVAFHHQLAMGGTVRSAHRAGCDHVVAKGLSADGFVAKGLLDVALVPRRR